MKIWKVFVIVTGLLGLALMSLWAFQQLRDDTITVTDSTEAPIVIPFLGPGESITISTDSEIFTADEGLTIGSTSSILTFAEVEVCIKGHCAPIDVVQAFIEGWLERP